MGGFQKTACSYGAPYFPVAKVQYVLHLGVIHPNAKSGPWQLLEAPKYFKLLFPCAKLTAHHTNLK
jgi:hypothetical protein